MSKERVQKFWVEIRTPKDQKPVTPVEVREALEDWTMPAKVEEMRR